MLAAAVLNVQLHDQRLSTQQLVHFGVSTPRSQKRTVDPRLTYAWLGLLNVGQTTQTWQRRHCGAFDTIQLRTKYTEAG
jgi:hypothetical protein